MNWLRLHTELKHDRQLQQMPAETFRHLINIWCIAKEHEDGGKLPKLADLAFQLRLEEEDCKSLTIKLMSMGLLVKESDTLAVKNWSFWQSRDDSKNRVRALRSRSRNGDCNGSGNDSVTVGVTVPCVTVTATEQSRAEQIEQSRARAPLATPTETPSTPIGLWTEKLRDRHPTPCEPRYIHQFCFDNWHRLSEDTDKYEFFMAVVFDGLESHCRYWAEDGNRFAMALDKWLSGGGWKKAPPERKTAITERDARIKRQEAIDASWEVS